MNTLSDIMPIASSVQETAEILATGLTRLEARKSSRKPTELGESLLHFSPDQSGGVPPSSAEADVFQAPGQEKTILSLIKQSLSQVDVDIRPALLANVVVTGGSSLIPGLVQRLNLELDRMYPSTRVRMHASGNVVERKFGSWIGGSIMASLGTFHQMWISKKEYEEHGAGIVEKRCK